MKVRTNDRHNFPVELATTAQFRVNELPATDFAAKALHDAQARYFQKWPEAKKYAHALIWTIDVDDQADSGSIKDAVERIINKGARNPFDEPKREAIPTPDNRELTMPVTPEVAAAIQRVAETTTEALAEALAPFGLHPHDIAAPRYERMVYRDELG